ncbi:ATP synthase subunit I [Alkalinema sp. FACHB-956]|uniref:ATP synthase subunit I n=1 Tax=Alkalinema sp. FACHB-956 TaxID=2692768 RepID=UPI0018EFB4CC|nr:ATP synthase subunit I [Alkalinema sp. FACHB-956]
MEDIPQASVDAIEQPPVEVEEGSSSQSMDEYYALQRELIVTTIVLMGLIFPAVWFFYDLNVALNYLMGAFTGVIYLRLLGKNVEKLGQGASAVGKSQIAVFVGVMILATQLKQLSILPIFLGFLTYKATLIIYTLRILLVPDRSANS